VGAATRRVSWNGGEFDYKPRAPAEWVRAAQAHSWKAAAEQYLKLYF
jgi:hypothetical protein